MSVYLTVIKNHNVAYIQSIYKLINEYLSISKFNGESLIKIKGLLKNYEKNLPNITEDEFNKATMGKEIIQYINTITSWMAEIESDIYSRGINERGENEELSNYTLEKLTYVEFLLVGIKNAIVKLLYGLDLKLNVRQKVEYLEEMLWNDFADIRMYKPYLKRWQRQFRNENEILMDNNKTFIDLLIKARKEEKEEHKLAKIS